MHSGDKLLIVCAAAKRKPQYREAFLEEFVVPPQPKDEMEKLCALWVEVMLTDLIKTWRQHGRAHW